VALHQAAFGVRVTLEECHLERRYGEDHRRYKAGTPKYPECRSGRRWIALAVQPQDAAAIGHGSNWQWPGL
jgi:hypothetical protein